MLTTQESLTGYGEEQENASIQKLVMLTYRKFWEELHFRVSKDILVEAECVLARLSKKDKKNMSQFEKFVTDGNEKADELAKAGAVLDEGFMADTRV